MLLKIKVILAHKALSGWTSSSHPVTRWPWPPRGLCLCCPCPPVCTSQLLWQVQAAGVCVVCGVCARVCACHMWWSHQCTCTVTHTCPHAQCTHAHTHTHTHQPHAIDVASSTHSWKGGDVCLLQKWDALVEVISNGLVRQTKQNKQKQQTVKQQKCWLWIENLISQGSRGNLWSTTDELVSYPSPLPAAIL